MLVAAVALAEDQPKEEVGEMCIWEDDQGVTHFTCEDMPKPGDDICVWVDDEGVTHFSCEDEGPQFFVENENGEMVLDLPNIPGIEINDIT
jgi:hypothetical protein